MKKVGKFFRYGIGGNAPRPSECVKAVRIDKMDKRELRNREKERRDVLVQTGRASRLVVRRRGELKVNVATVAF